MLVLLPPSETKRAGGSGRLEPDALAFAGVLGDARARVRAALESLSRDPEAAAKPLKLGVKNRGELEHNLRLGESGVLPAIERYTGVLYDALDAQSLAPSARAWLDGHVLVQSALFGLVGAGDPIPAYRLSAGSRLPGLDAPLKRVWAAAHAGISAPRDASLVLDLRSQDYAALAPVPTGRLLHVVQRGPDGETRALNHFNKAAKGDLVRRLAASGADFATLDALLSWADRAGLELYLDGDESDAPSSARLTLVTELGTPGTASRANAGAR